MNNLATSSVTVERHPEDSDYLPVTHAWRTVVSGILVDNKTAKDAEMRGEHLWTRAKLAKACKTTSSQILKLLDNNAKSSPLVRRINEVLEIPFIEPFPISRERYEVINMILEFDDLAWLTQTVHMIKKD